MAFRFVHTADIHLDSPLRTLALRGAALAELVGAATRKAFRHRSLSCRAGRCAADRGRRLYGGEQTSMKTGRLLADQLKREHESGRRTFIIRGDHDAESRIARELTLPESVNVLGGRAEWVAVGEGGLDVVVHGVSFAPAN